MARTHHDMPPTPKPDDSEHKPGLAGEASEKPAARARRTKPPVPPKALQQFNEEDVLEETHVVEPSDIEEVEELDNGHLEEIKDEAPVAAKAKGRTPPEGVTILKPFEPDAHWKTAVQNPKTVEKLKKIAEDKEQREHTTEWNTRLARAKAKEADPMTRLERTVDREQASASQETGTSLQLEVMDAWKNFDAAKEAYEKIGPEYAAEYQRTMELVNSPTVEFDEGVKEYMIQTLLRRNGAQQRHEAALQAYANAERAYLDRYAQWELELDQKQELKKQYEADFDQLVEGLSGKKYSAQEEAWFKQGEDDERKIAATRAEIEGPESLVETPAEIEANVAQAAAMLKSGELHPSTFDLDAYGSLLKEKARLDLAIEMGSGATARRLQGELKTVQKDLNGYEEQIQGVFNERHSGDQPLTAREKTEIAAKPWRKQELPQGSGTTIKKKGFFARLFGR